MDDWAAKYLTYVVPTHNRPQFVRRLLTYWTVFSPHTRILVADSSDDANCQENRRIVEQFQRSLSLSYRYVDVQVPFYKFAEAAKLVETDFMVFCADDDFLVPETVTKCLKYLRSHSDTICAQGMETKVFSAQKHACKLERGFSISNESAGCRFRQMARDLFSTFYGVFRTRELNISFRAALECPDFRLARIYPELTLTHMTVLQGKVKVFPRHYMIRQFHDLNEHRLVRRVEDVAHAEEHYLKFREVQVSQLEKYACIDRASGEQVIDLYYDSYRQGRRSKRGLAGISQIVRREFRKLMGPFVQNGVLERRWLKANHPLCQNPAFQLAGRLIRDYPDGMTENEVDDEQRRPASTVSVAA